MADNANTQTLDEVVGRLQRTIGEDDYSIIATVVEEGSVDLRVLARDDACAECLVPKDMMRLIADNFLAEIEYRVRELAYPEDAHGADG
jgi:predicted GTPase